MLLTFTITGHVIFWYVGSLLSVVLVLRVKVVNSVRDNVFGVHGFLQVTGDRLERNRTTRGYVTFLWGVETVRECVTQSNGSKEHLDTDEEVLITGRYSAGSRDRRSVF